MKLELCVLYHVTVSPLCCTFVDTVAEATLVAATSVDELHERTHVGLAAVTADRAGFAVVHDV